MFTVRIDTDNAAFEDYPTEEVARILDRIAGDLREGEESGVCRDINGNTVGGWELVS